MHYIREPWGARKYWIVWICPDLVQLQAKIAVPCPSTSICARVWSWCQAGGRRPHTAACLHHHSYLHGVSRRGMWRSAAASLRRRLHVDPQTDCGGPICVQNPAHLCHQRPHLLTQGSVLARVVVVSRYEFVFAHGMLSEAVGGTSVGGTRHALCQSLLWTVFGKFLGRTFPKNCPHPAQSLCSAISEGTR